MANATAQAPMSPLQHLQNRFAIMDLGGEIRLLDRHQVTGILSGAIKGDVSFYKKPDGNLMMKRMLESLPLPCKAEAVVADFWVSPQTKLYSSTAFSPLPTSPGTLNFWVGHAPNPAPGNWRILRDYLLDVLSDGNQEVYEYLVKYMAHMVQRPEEKPGVMIVLLGGQGTGKGVYFTLLRAIWPRSTLQVAKIDQVVGKFTSALERSYIICMDEALFAGDRQAIDNLKSIVTETHLHIEQKYQPSRTIESHHRLFAASNDEHFAHFEQDDRRFVFLRVSDIHRQDTRYFSGIAAAIANPGTIKALLYYLQRKDLASFNVRAKPQTNEQQAQKIKSLQGFERYWYEVLCTGNFSLTDSRDYKWGPSTFIATKDLMDKYKEHNKNAERYQTLQASQIKAKVAALCPSAKVGIREKSRDHRGETQVRGARVPTLDLARKEFSDYLGEALTWESDDASQHELDSDDTDKPPRRHEFSI